MCKVGSMIDRCSYDLEANIDVDTAHERIAVPYRKPREQSYGHGCGQNLLAVAAIGSSNALKEEMQYANIPGKIVFYGWPAEELCLTKGIMAKRGAFDEPDVALAWHPGCYNRSASNSCTGSNTTHFHFRGKAPM